MLLIDLRDLQRGPVATDGELPPEDDAFAGLGIELAAPLAVRGKLQATGDGELLWRGHLTGRARGTCRRCLAEVELPLDASVDVLFTADPEAADDPSVYPLAPRATQVDLRPAIREEVALAVPPYVLCREECRGLCPRCGADLNQGPCGCAVAENRT
jgi:uncharacterized protein